MLEVDKMTKHAYDDWQKGQDDAFAAFRKKLADMPEMTVPASVRIRRDAEAARQKALAEKQAGGKARAENNKERITDDKGRDMMFKKPNTDKIKDPMFIATRTHIRPPETPPPKVQKRVKPDPRVRVLNPLPGQEKAFG